MNSAIQFTVILGYITTTEVTIQYLIIHQVFCGEFLLSISVYYSNSDF